MPHYKIILLLLFLMICVSFLICNVSKEKELERERAIRNLDSMMTEKDTFKTFPPLTKEDSLSLNH